jgi:hypothetical protein
MGLCLFFLPNFPGATFIQGDTFIPDSREVRRVKRTKVKCSHGLPISNPKKFHIFVIVLASKWKFFPVSVDLRVFCIIAI